MRSISHVCRKTLNAVLRAFRFSSCMRSDKVRELATMCWPWQHMDKNLSMVWWPWHISVLQLRCCWSRAVSFWVACIIIWVCFDVIVRPHIGKLFIYLTKFLVQILCLWTLSIVLFLYKTLSCFCHKTAIRRLNSVFVFRGSQSIELVPIAGNISRTVDNLHRLNIYTDVPSSQTIRSYWRSQYLASNYSIIN
jgi:hypothetical protein